MSTFVRYSAVVALCLATGLFSSGCNLKKGEEKELETPTEEPEEKGAEGEIFEEEGDVSARKASEDALGTTETEAPGTDVDLETEEVDAPKVEEPEADIKM